ncbi:MAG: BatA domain-containing protein [Ignavibacteriales bacterium]|nr:BatA domain-containing protein [Ignavibacteriales bacterium]
MTFLNPALLLGLIAAAIPILLHLLNLRRLRTIEFSTLTFLKELQRTRIRRLKIRQLLLMVLRTLLVMLLVLAFARPTLKGSIMGSIGSHGKTTIVLLIDDSFSMTVSDQQGELLKQAKQTALAIIGLLKEGDEVSLVKFSDVKRPSMERQHAPSRDPQLVSRTIEELKPSPIHTKLIDALRYSAKVIAGSANFNREIYLVSDFQRGLLERSVTSTPDAESLFPTEVRFFLMPLGKRPVQNFGVEAITIPGAIFERGKPFTVKAQIGNYSGEKAQNHLVGLFLNGTRVAQRGVDLLPGTSSEVEFSVTSGETGFVEGFLELEDDDAQYDNRRSFTVYLPERINVLLAGTEAETRYVRLALAARESHDGSAFDLQEVSVEGLGSTHLRDAHVLVLVAPEILSSAQANQIGTFVANGGGLIVFPGTGGRTEQFNTSFASQLKLPSVIGVDGAPPQTPNGNAESFVEFDRIELRHPLFQGMFDAPEPTGAAQDRGRQRTVESPRILRSIRYALSAQSNQIITLTNGSAFLLEHQKESGRILMFAVAPDLPWSDFPLKGLFVPLLHRSVSYLAGEQHQSMDYLAGDAITIRSVLRTSGPWTIRNPSMIEVVATPRSRGAQQSVRFGETEAVGLYTVSAGTGVIRKFAVNLHRDESNTMPSEPSDVKVLLEHMGVEPSAISLIDHPQEAQRLVLESRFGVELWKHLLIAALLVAMAEMIVARISKQELTPVSS